MGSDDPALQPVIVLRVVIRSPDLETFVSKYSRFVKDDRIFIFTKSSQAPGTRVRFTLELADGQPLIHGEGTVTRIRADSGDATKPPGMELTFTPLDDRSRDLVARMLRARESTGHFKEETTDAQTRVRETNAPNAAVREFAEAPRTLEPLERTGAQRALRDDSGRRALAEDESGAVTIAQAPPGERTSPDAAPTLPPPIPADADKQSGNFATPTPLPAPIPASDDFAAGQRELSQSALDTRLGRPGHDRHQATALAALVTGDSGEHFDGRGPTFAEAFRAPVPGAPEVRPPSGTVPANPFSEVSNGAIEYFVEWSVEQSTAPRPKVALAHFANVAMATPRAEKRRTARGPLFAGMAIGVFLGVPIGGAIVWYGKPPPAPVIVDKGPELTPPRPADATLDLGTLAAAAAPDLGRAAALATPDMAKAVAVVAPPPPQGKKAELVIASRPPGAAVTVDGAAQGKTPVTLSVPAGSHDVVLTRERYATVTQSVEAPGKLDIALKRPTATLHVESEPPGGEVVVEGKPRGKTPVDVTLDAFHHYDVQVTLVGTKPWHKKVLLRPPQINVIATFSAIHEE